MNEPTVVIRPAVKADAAILAHLIHELAVYEKLVDSLVATPELLEQHLFGTHPAAQALIAYLDGEPVGYAIYFQTFSTFLAKPCLYLEDLFVLPRTRGKRIGFALLARVAAIAQERQAGRLEWAVLDWNEPAIDFYKKLGAKPVSDFTVFRLEGDALAEVAGKSR